MNQEHAYALAVEKLLGLEEPRRGQYIRVLYAEIGRILAAGVVRLNATKSSGLSAENRDSFVDFSPRKSGGCRAKRIRIGGIHEASQ